MNNNNNNIKLLRVITLDDHVSVRIKISLFILYTKGHKKISKNFNKNWKKHNM